MRTQVIALFLALSGCDREVVVDSDSGSSSETASNEPISDPRGACASYLLRHGRLDCEWNPSWGQTGCEKFLAAANERGCVDEALSNFECYAEKCHVPDVQGCDVEGERMSACLRGEGGAGGASPE